jgi:predicted O-methyltransferase YrrM
MTATIEQPYPTTYLQIDKSTVECGFTMASDVLTCSLLRTLAATKPSGKFLELGTGTGLSTSWILDGMDLSSTLISVDHEPSYLSITENYLADDKRLSLVNSDGGDWIAANKHLKFDYIFADTWHGKYLLLDETLSMLNEGALYIVDDLLRQPNWPAGHENKVAKLIQDLERKEDLIITKQNWATGIIIAVKKRSELTNN